MAAKISRLFPGLAATALAAAAGVTIYWVGLPEKPAAIAPGVQAKAPKTDRLPQPSWSPDRPGSLKGDAEQYFRKGMEAYMRRDYSTASNLLYKAAALAPEAAEVHFFLGISYLMTRDTIAGIRELKMTTGLGRGPYEFEARLHLGQALIERGDAASAREYLAPVTADRGIHGEQARALISASYPTVGSK